MTNDLISRKVVLNYLKIEKDKLIEGYKNGNNVIPIEARKGALLCIKAMTNFIIKLKGIEKETC